MWPVADRLNVPRLAAAGILAVALMISWLIVSHHMWERRKNHPSRALASLYNTTTVVTLLIGVLTMYAGLLLLGFLGQAILVDRRLLAQVVGHPVDWGQRTRPWAAPSARDSRVTKPCAPLPTGTASGSDVGFRTRSPATTTAVATTSRVNRDPSRESG
jgi:hypothetical protein